MAETNGAAGPRYSVSMTGAARAEYLEIARQSVALGRDEAVSAAMRQTSDRLRRNPRQLGDPLFHFRNMRMTVMNAAVPPLYIEYGVHDDQPVVVIRRVRWLTDPSGG